MPTHPSEVNEAARRWAIRVGDPAFDDWDALTAWLEADTAHLAAYEAAIDGADWAAAALKPPNAS
jgi:ferric-dicitrate binding protein FerR (iron transport regulator)